MSKFPELREKLEAATQGEWYWTEYDGKGALTLAVPGPVTRIGGMVISGHERNILKTTSDWPPTQADAELIVAAVNALPELLKLEDENAALRRERDAARRGIMELYHLEMITMSRARELMGFNHIDPVRELYKKLKPEFDRVSKDMGITGVGQ